MNSIARSASTIGVNVSLAPPDLSEFLADNSDGRKDEDGDTSDWIELRNPNAFPLDFDGYFLTDDPADLQKWRLPTVRIQAYGFLLVFASGKDRRDPRAELHTNFKLDANGDFVALVDRGGTDIIRPFPSDYPVMKIFPKQRKNVSYGIGSNDNIGFFRSQRPAQSTALPSPALSPIPS